LNFDLDLSKVSLIVTVGSTVTVGSGTYAPSVPLPSLSH